jgi:hypothetical protein
MNILIKLWKWRWAIIIPIISIWLYYMTNKIEKKEIEQERLIAAEMEEKKLKENALLAEYEKNKKRLNCNIAYKVTLETYGESVSVELRVGEVGNSFPLVIKQASGGQLEYKKLCPANYFIAIGNDKNVSTTPIQNFESGRTYTSNVYLTKGVGNMGSSRREKL